MSGVPCSCRVIGLCAAEAAKESIEQPPDADADGGATTSSPTLRPPPVAADGEEADVAAQTRRRKLSKAQETTDALAIGVINTIVTLPVTCAPAARCAHCCRAPHVCSAFA